MKRIRAIPPELVVALLLFGGGLLLLAPGYIPVVGQVIEPVVPPPTVALPNNESTSPPATEALCVADKPTFLTLPSNSKHKESPYAFGNPVKIGENDDRYGKVMDTILTTTQKDPAITAVLTTVFDPDGDMTKVDNRTQYYIGDHKNWCAERNIMYNIAGPAFVKLVHVDAGIRSLCMKKSPDDVAPVKVYRCKTGSAGTAALFKWKDSQGNNRTVQLRLDCLLQPVGSFPGVPDIPKSPQPKPSHTASTSAHPSSSASPSPESKVPSQDPAPRGNAPAGGGHDKTPGPGKSVAPSDVPTVPSEAYTAPAPPS